MTETTQDTGAFTPMPQYQCYKKVWALEIESVEQVGTDTTTEENEIVLVTFVDKTFAPRKFNLRGKPTPAEGWYMVQYEDGYTSFSPKAAFEAGYTRIDPAKQSAQALEKSVAPKPLDLSGFTR